MLQIGQIELPNMPLILAPLEGITDSPFRAICKQMGADLVYSEFVSSDAIIRNVQKSLDKLKITKPERPVALQVFGHDEDSIKKAVEVVESMKPDMIDLNFGCPVKKIVTKGAGAAMLKEPAKLIRIAAQAVKATSLPVSVKTRIGWDVKTPVIEYLAPALQDVGIKALALHARFARQMYGGLADWSWFEKVKAIPYFSIPLFGNGDIKTPEDAARLITTGTVDGLMIGRAVVGNPWIFTEIKHYLQTGNLLPPPGIKERIKICKQHFEGTLTYKTEHRAVMEMRQHYSKYFKGIAGFKGYKLALYETINQEQVFTILGKIGKDFGAKPSARI